MADISILDQPEGYGKHDPENMLGHVQALARQTREAYDAGRAIELPDRYRFFKSVVVAGMGGSAIGGSLVAGLAEPHSPIPILVQRGYTLPKFVDDETLVIVSSYSGNTEETLNALADALERNVPLLFITTGGQVAQRARELGAPTYAFDYKSQPRAAVGYSFGAVLGIATRLGLLPNLSADLSEAEQVLETLAASIGPDVPTVRNPAKKLASELMGDFPFIFAAEHLAPVARRWKGQLNENSKNWAAYDEFPELNHNTVVGFDNPYIAPDDVFVVMLDSDLYHDRVRARLAPTGELLDRANIAHITLQAPGKSHLAQVLAMIHLGDYVSYYLALLNEVDPTPVESIDFLKSRLAK